MTPAIRGIQDVAEKNLCQGCGTCAYVQPEAVRMVDDLRQGRRPLVLHVQGRPVDTSEAVACCPGLGYSHDRKGEHGIEELRAAWGPVLEVWEGHAGDSEIRHAASSGGAASALALHAILEEGMSGVLHIDARKDVPYLNETVYSTTREQLLSATGSRYAPASPCDRLDLIEAAATPSVFIGKPCDVAGVHLARARRPQLDAKVGLTIAVFCAGTPAASGTLELMAAAGVSDPTDLKSVKYRGDGWPGEARVVAVEKGQERITEFTYEQSWGEILQKHRQWRCHVCADHTGELADVAVGDHWYRPVAGDPGRSLVLVRTERGRALVAAAVASGALVLERVPASTLPASQMNLLRGRGAIWGRIAMMRLALLPAPRFGGMPTFRFWVRELDTRQRAQSTIGTLRRIRTKHLRRRAVVNAFEAGPRRLGRTLLR